MLVPRNSTVHSDLPVRVVKHNQELDSARGSFYTSLETTTKRYRGKPIYKDQFGQRLILV